MNLDAVSSQVISTLNVDVVESHPNMEKRGKEMKFALAAKEKRLMLMDPQALAKLALDIVEKNKLIADHIDL